MNIPVFQVQIVTESAQIGATGTRRLWRVIVGGQTGSGKAVFDNSAAGDGTVLMTVSALADSECDIDFTKVGGIAFDTAMYCTLTGTGAIAYVFFE
jgi:hypothetical protein